MRTALPRIGLPHGIAGGAEDQSSAAEHAVSRYNAWLRTLCRGLDVRDALCRDDECSDRSLSKVGPQLQ